MLKEKDIFINCQFDNKQQAEAKIFEVMLADGCDVKYIESIAEREKMASFNIGRGIVIPHGTYEASKEVNHSRIFIWHLQNGIQWDEGEARLIVALYLNPNDQLETLQNIAINAMNEEFFKDLLANPTKEKIIQLTKDN